MPRREFKSRFPEIVVCVDGVDYQVAKVSIELWEAMANMKNDSTPQELRKIVSQLMPSMPEDVINKMDITMLLDIMPWITEQITAGVETLPQAEKNESRPADVQ